MAQPQAVYQDQSIMSVDPNMMQTKMKMQNLGTTRPTFDTPFSLNVPNNNGVLNTATLPSTQFGPTNQIKGINAPLIAGAPQTQLSNFTDAAKQSISTQIQPAAKPQSQGPAYDVNKVVGEFGATVLANPNEDIEVLKTKFPEFVNIDTKVLGELGATFIAHPDDSIQTTLAKFPELTQGNSEQKQGFVDRLTANVQGLLQQGEGIGKGGVALLDKFLGTEDIANSIQYAQDKYGMSPAELKQKAPDKYNAFLEEVANGATDKYKTTASQDVLNVAEGSLAAAQTVAAPLIVAGITVAGSTEPGTKALGVVSDVFGGVGELVNYVPGLSDFKNSLPEEDQKRFDLFVGNVVGSLLLGTKNKGNILKDPKTFISENVGSKQIIDNFKQNVLGVKDKAVEAVNFAKEKSKPIIDKLNPSIDANDVIVQEAQKNPYIVDELNNIHATTEGKMAEVDAKTYKDTAVKKVGDEFIQPALDSIEAQYKEGGQMYQKIRADKQPIDVNGLDTEAQAIANDYPQSTLTATDKRNIATALQKVSDIMKDAKDGKFTTDVALDTRQAFDRDIDYNMSSSKGNEAVKKIRAALDKRLKEQVVGLAETDKLASNKIRQLQEFKKQLIKKDGTINYQNLKNVNNLSKTDLAKKLDEFVPGATDRIDAIDQAVKLAKKTKGIGLVGKIGTRLASGALGTLIPGIGNWAGFVIGELFAPMIDNLINGKLSEYNQAKVLKFFSELSPEATKRLEEIGKKIERNEALNAADQVLIEKARSKSNIEGVKQSILDSTKQDGAIQSTTSDNYSSVNSNPGGVTKIETKEVANDLSTKPTNATTPSASIDNSVSKSNSIDTLKQEAKK